jgi:hypothetical protein
MSKYISGAENCLNESIIKDRKDSSTYYIYFSEEIDVTERC